MRISDNDSDRYNRSRTYGNIATTVPCYRGCCIDERISRASCVLLVKDTTGETLQLPLSHICFTHCVFTSRFLSEYFAPADLIIIIV